MDQTPQQKARQLVERFYFALPNNGSQTGINNVHSRWEEGKKCAQIAADEMTKTFAQLHAKLVILDVLNGPVEETATHQYLLEVKEEINKL